MVKTVARSSHVRNIILQSLLVSIPMFASSTIVIYIVYANIVSERCAVEALCPEPTNATSSGNYLVDFPAARLAFISSGSATMSFALLGVLMTMYSYVNAASFLRTSENDKHEALPTPFHASVMLRLLNAEMTMLSELASSTVKRVFWYREKHEDTPSQSPNLIRRCSSVFIVCIITSLLIQAADVYFHVAAKAALVVQYSESVPPLHLYSRGLAPWCIQQRRFGSAGEEKFWGCAITAQQAAYNNATSLAPTNASIISDMKNGVSDQHKTITFADGAGVQYAIVGPANNDVNVDWKASSFGVSTTCSAIIETTCNVSKPIAGAKDGQNNPIMLVPFNCSQGTTGPRFVGNLTSQNTVTHMMDFHKYMAESRPFFENTLARLNVSIPANGIEDSNDGFTNGWDVLAMRKIPSAVQGDFSQLPASFSTDTRIWKHSLLGAFVLMNCRVTVWELTYTSIAAKIDIVNKTPSNGTVAGIASMSGTRQLGILANIFQDESTGPLSRSSPNNFISSFEIGMSKAYSYPLASQLSGRPSLLVQTRTTKVVTSLAATALWSLVAANFVYALLGIGIALYAILRATEEVGEIKTKLSVEGVVAALFAREQSEDSGNKKEYFERKESVNTTETIAIALTTREGLAFRLSK